MTRHQAISAALASIGKAFPARVDTRTPAQQADLEQWQAERGAWEARQPDPADYETRDKWRLAR